MTVRKKTRFQSATFNQHKILIKLKKKHYNNKYRHFKLRFESNKIVETSNLKLATTLVWPTLKSAITLFTKDLSFIWLLSSYIKTINFTDLSGVKLNKALICKSIFGLWNFTHFYWQLITLNCLRSGLNGDLHQHCPWTITSYWEFIKWSSDQCRP